MTVEIVTVNGKQYANLGSSVEAKKLTKRMVLIFGGLRYRWNGNYIYSTGQFYGTPDYQALVNKAVEMVEA